MSQLWTPTRKPGENVLIYDPIRRLVLASGHNTFTDVGRQQLMQFLKGSISTGPLYIALGEGVILSTDALELQTALTAEYYRAQVPAAGRVLDAADVARLTLDIGQDLGVGTIKQVGLTTDVETIDIMHNCESVTGWSDPATSPSNLVVLDNVYYQTGNGSVKDAVPAGSTNSLLLKHTTLNKSVTGYTPSTAYIQFFVGKYQVYNWADIGGRRIRFGNDASNYWEFEPEITAQGAGSLEVEWQWISKLLSECGGAGSPSLGSTLNYFELLLGNPGTWTAGPVMWLDNIRLYKRVGNLWAIFQLDTPIEKTQRDQIVVSWYITAAEGDTDVADKVSFAREQLTVTNGAIKTLSSSVYAPAGGSPAQRASIRIVSGDPVVIDPLGAPNNAGTVGTIWYPGEDYPLESQEDISTVGLIGYVPSGMSRTTSTIIEASYKR